MYALLAIVLALIVYGTLFPFHFAYRHTQGGPFLFLLRALPASFGPGDLRDAVLNVAIFMPLGAAACLAVSRRHGRAAGYAFALGLGAALSATIEMLQIYDAGRYCSILDWICNTIGAALGAALALVFQPRIEKLLSAVSRRDAPAALLLAGCWFGYQLYPLIPQFTRGHVRPAWDHLRTAPISAVEVFAGAAGWYVAAFALKTVWLRMPAFGLLLAMLAAPLRFFIIDRTLSASDLLACALGLLMWTVTPDKARHGVAWLLLFAAIIVRELAPFHPGRFHGFSWALLSASMHAPSVAAAAVILRKAFEYGAAVWLLRLNKLGYLAAGVSVAAVLAAMEALQCFLPGRQPEITDSVIALIMAAALRLVEARR